MQITEARGTGATSLWRDRPTDGLRLVLGPPPEGLARLPMGLVVAGLASSLLFFPVVPVAAVLTLDAAQRKT